MSVHRGRSGDDGRRLVITGGRVFDGLVDEATDADIAIEGSRVQTVAEGIEPSAADLVIDATGLWVVPGLLDIHTHLDLEVEFDPRLREAVRHGTTTAVVGNCSLGLAFGAQAYPGRADDPQSNAVVDCFARVENIPKGVLADGVSDHVRWSDPEGYARHFDDVDLGANVACLIPHSNLRIHVMGMPDAIERDPTSAELERMCSVLSDALALGYPGMSTDGLPLHYLANEPWKNEAIPAQHAGKAELAALFDVVRAHDGIVQLTPDPDDLKLTLWMLTQTVGRFRARPLRMTVTAALDLVQNRRAVRPILALARILNSRALGGRIRFQALSAPFHIHAEGVTTPLMEERPAFRELLGREYDDVDGRRQLLDDPAFRDRFRDDWFSGRRGFAGVLRRLGLDRSTFSRELDDMVVRACPGTDWTGETLGSLWRRRQLVRSGSVPDADASMLEDLAPWPIVDESDFLLALLRRFDLGFRWSVLVANDRPDVLEELLFHDCTLPGFNDSGAHLANMAFFDGNLRTLAIASRRDERRVAEAVRRLTSEPAALFGLDVGRIQVGAVADLVLIDPNQLADYDGAASTRIEYDPVIGHPRMINRSDGVVRAVIVGGEVVFDDGEPVSQIAGHGRFLQRVGSDR
ncbi:MAG: amidohydrolase family protein [Acidimicrobiales bacterium]|nr:amidohydrolase family protein [Acidimicrobiales bacterium]